MNQLLLSLSLLLFSTTITSAQTKVPDIERSPLTIGETVSFDSEVLNEERRLNIYLPHRYSEENEKTYPVIYLLDGSIDEDFVHIAGLVQFGSFSWIQMVPESIVVGIANVDRKRDFTFPTSNEEDKAKFPTTGNSEAFIRFIEQELQPLVNANYRTQASTTLIGQSLGGLLATEILFKKPELFNNYVIVSPSLWWDDESLLANTPHPDAAKTSVYVAVGKEGPIMERTAKALFDKLHKELGDDAPVYYQYLEAQDHGDALHLAVYGAFEKIFAKKAE
ncbi:MAG: alpha/beta hydrolase-fold protein [Bacteroidota bacterium]